MQLLSVSTTQEPRLNARLNVAQIIQTRNLVKLNLFPPSPLMLFDIAAQIETLLPLILNVHSALQQRPKILFVSYQCFTQKISTAAFLIWFEDYGEESEIRDVLVHF